MLANQGYIVGYRRVARLLKEKNLSVSVKRFPVKPQDRLKGRILG